MKFVAKVGIFLQKVAQKPSKYTKNSMFSVFFLFFYLFRYLKDVDLQREQREN
jgi:hypothetical protein